MLSDGRFTLGLGAGENLNEHVVGQRWPAVGERQDMLEEALVIIRDLLDGERVTYDGRALPRRLRPALGPARQPVPIGVAVSGAQSVVAVRPLADHLVAVEPDADLVIPVGRRPRATRPAVAQDRADPDLLGAGPRRGRRPAHEQFRWFGGGWKVNADLPTTEAFEAASQFVRPEDVAESIPCGPDLDAIVEAVRAYWEAGFTDVALVQVGDERRSEFLDEAAGPLLERLRAAAPAH